MGCGRAWKSSRTIRAPSPTYFCTSSLPITRMKHASVRLATARASSVFPVPAHASHPEPLVAAQHGQTISQPPCCSGAGAFKSCAGSSLARSPHVAGNFNRQACSSSEQDK